jgi:hypothetical protein
MAEINYNDLYNQMGLLDQKFYDSTFKNAYNPNKSQTMLEGKSGYDQMKAAYEAEQQIPEKSFMSGMIDTINPFSELSAAEMPQVPNVSLGTPQINFNTGITGASSAIPNINGVPMINTGAYNQKLQNTDLVSQIIAENQAANANNSQSFLENDPAFGQLFFQREQDPNNPTNTLYAMKQDSSMLPSYGGVSGYRNVGIPQINNQVPLGFDTSYGVANEADEEQEYLPGQKKKLSDMGRNFGISSLIGMITGNPIFGLLSKGAGGIRNLNNKIQNSMFGKSKTGAEYFNNRKIAAATGSKDFMNRPRSERNFTGPSGNNNTGGGPGSKGASDSFSNKSGMGRTGY